ncbi:MAG TPA: hypothetical protein VF843_17090, partial [Streptosporangiaceae bacterium]
TPAETSGFLTAAPMTAELEPAELERAELERAELEPADPVPAAPMALADGHGLLSPAQEIQPDLPRREPGTTGLAWHEITGYDWSANGVGTAHPRPGAEPSEPGVPDNKDESTPAEPGAAEPSPGEPAVAEPAAVLDGLPVRVRQASLAPQLRQAAAGTSKAAETSPPAGVPSPDAARNTMAALQLGWQRGRSVISDDEQHGQDEQVEPPARDQQDPGDQPQEAPDEGGAA